MAKIEVNSILILFVEQKFPDGIKYTFNKTPLYHSMT